MTIKSARGVALLFFVCAAAQAVSAGDGPLPNGDLEYPPDRSQMNGSRVTGEGAIPHWKASGFVEYIESGQTQGDMILTVPQGAHAVRLGNEASIRQPLAVTPGGSYSVTISAARTCAQSEKLSVSVSPSGAPSEMIPIQTVYSSDGWDSYSWAFKAEQSAVSLIIYHSHEQVDDPACGPIIDSVAIKSLYTPQPTQNNMLKNGDFEEGPYIAPDCPSGVLLPPDDDNISPLPGWMIMSYSKVVKYIDSGHFSVPQGSRAVELVAGQEAALVQEVDTVPGTSYRLEFSVGDAADGCTPKEQPIRVKASTADGSTLVTYDSRGTGGYKRAALEFKASGSRTRVVLTSPEYHTKSDSSGTLCGPVVDDVSLVAVPQPPARRRLLR